MKTKKICLLITFIMMTVINIFAQETTTLYLIRPKSLVSRMLGKSVSVEVAGVNIGRLPNKKHIKIEVPTNMQIYISANYSKLGMSDMCNKIITLENGQIGYVQLKCVAKVVGTKKVKGKEEPVYNYEIFLSELGSSSGERLVKKTKETEGEDLDLLAKTLELQKIEHLSQHLAMKDVKDMLSDMKNIKQEQTTLKEEQSTINKQYEEIKEVTAKDMPAPTIESEVDINIPVTDKKAEKTYALIIANENYEFVDNVDYATHDGDIFKEYCIKTLGIPEKQVLFVKNATAGMMDGEINKLVKLANIDAGANIIVYYCGHGIPDESTNEAYLIPVDGKGANIVTCYSLNKLYTTLAATKAANITYFLDACFTGSNREGSMLVAARGVAREAKKEMLSGNTVVFAAASQDETAMAYKEKTHGMFTYFLLKKLQDTKGNVTYRELAEYIKNNVQKESILVNDKSQSPNIATSTAVNESWGSMTLK